MKLKLIAAVSALAGIPALAHAQQGGPQPNVPKPTKVDVQNVVQIVTTDKAKTQAYCDLTKLYDQVEAGQQNNDFERSKRSPNKPTHWSTSSVLNTPKW